MKTKLLFMLTLISYNLFSQTHYLPTVVHVLYFDQSEDMTYAEVEELINHVNLGLRGLSQNNTVTREIFDTLWADTNFQLCLAKSDQNGLPTNGVIHQQITSPVESGDHFRAKGESTPWDTDLYLNIWISSMGEGSELSGGIATTPTVPHSTFPNPHIGVMLNNDSYNAPQILIHEVGHFLGLKHIYRDNIDDTPCSNNVINPEPDCKDDFLSLNTCSNEAPFWGSNNPPDMIENYMEYYGNCAKMFTKGQKAKMQEYANTHYSEMLNSQLASCELVLSENKPNEVNQYYKGHENNKGRFKLVLLN